MYFLPLLQVSERTEICAQDPESPDCPSQAEIDRWVSQIPRPAVVLVRDVANCPNTVKISSVSDIEGQVQGTVNMTLKPHNVLISSH